MTLNDPSNLAPQIDRIGKICKLVPEYVIEIAEKERSLGFINESFADIFSGLAQKQFPRSRERIDTFITALAQVEYGRKVMYQRYHNLAQRCFQTSSIFYQRTITQMKEREEKTKKQTITAADSRLFEQSFETFLAEFHRELKDFFSTFAHSQIEMYAKQLESWAKFVNTLEMIKVEQDVVQVRQLMEESLSLYSPQKP